MTIATEPLARPRRLLLITGAICLTERVEAELWARGLITGAVSELDARDVVLAGGAPGPDFWGAEAARSHGVFRVELRLDGGRYEDGVFVRAWGSDEERARHGPKRWPLYRNARLVEAARKAAAAGWEVRVLAFYAPWATTHGTAHTADLAREAGLTVIDFKFEEWPVVDAGEARLPAVWLDTETGGRSHKDDPLIEIGAVRADATHARPLATFETKLAVPPGMRVQDQARAINGYTPQAWRDAPAAPVALRALLAWLPARFVLCGYSVAFDRTFLRTNCARYGLAEPGWLPDAVDPMYTARKVLKRTGATESAKLDAVCAHLGIPSPARHRALADAERARLVHLALLGKKPEASVFDDGWKPPESARG